LAPQALEALDTQDRLDILEIQDRVQLLLVLRDFREHRDLREPRVFPAVLRGLEQRESKDFKVLRDSPEDRVLMELPVLGDPKALRDQPLQELRASQEFEVLRDQPA